MNLNIVYGSIAVMSILNALMVSSQSASELGKVMMCALETDSFRYTQSSTFYSTSWHTSSGFISGSPSYFSSSYTSNPLSAQKHFHLCTHLIINLQFASIQHNQDPWGKISDLKFDGLPSQIRQFRESFPHLKISLGISHSPQEYNAIASNAKVRRRFIRNAYNFIVKYEFDGLDLSWSLSRLRYENHVFDRDGLVLLVKEFSELFEWDMFSLTSKFDGSINDNLIKMNVTHELDIVGMSKYLDYIQIDSSDVFGDFIINQIPADKIVIQLPMYGRKTTTTFKNYLVPSSLTEDIPFGDICNKIAIGQWNTTYDTKRSIRVADFVDNGIHRSIEFKTGRSIASLLRKAMRSNFAGAMIEVYADDEFGKCALEKEVFADFTMTSATQHLFEQRPTSYTLLNTANTAMIIALDEIQTESQPKIVNN